MNAQLWTIDDVAEYLGLSRRTVEYMVYAQTGPKSARIGKRRMFRRADVEAWLDEKFASAAKESA